jgi:CubicO group peptidase (beta-lactamase class C family)
MPMHLVSFAEVLFVPGMIFCLLMTSPVVSATGIFQPQPDPRFNPLKNFMEVLIDKGQTAGIGVLIIKNESILFSGAAGWRDLENKLPMTTDTITHIGSCSKAISAAAILALADAGKLSLEDPVSKYIPDFGEPSPTLRQLLNHTSGIYSMARLTPGQQKAITDPLLTLKESAALISREPREAEPGRNFAYSGAAFMVAGRIAEIVSGKPFDELVNEKIFMPLGLHNTTFRPLPDQVPRISNIYRPTPDGLKLLMKFDPKQKVNLIRPPGGIYSTMEELAAFLVMLKTGEYQARSILSPASAREMRTLQTKGASLVFSGAGSDYSLGLYLKRLNDKGESEVVFHEGALGTFFYLDRKNNFIVVIFGNSPYFMVRNQVHEPLLKEILLLAQLE